MRFDSLCEIITAVHLSVYVTGPFEQRGGLMLVAPPGHLKTTAAEILQEYERTLVVSDVTVKTLTAMRDDLLGGNVYTLIFSDYGKIHKRHGSVASNIEGIVMGLVGEGFRKAAFSDQRIQALPARAAVIGCVTTKFAEKMEETWLDDGFYRRFLWCRYRVRDPEYLENAIAQWRKAEIDGSLTIRIPSNRTIPYRLEAEDVARLRYDLRFMRDKKLPLMMAQKIMCVLKWKFDKQDPALARNIWKDFAPSLMPDGAVLDVKERKEASSAHGK
jgi:hypothetical protein